MKLIDPSVSRAMGSLMKYLSPNEKYALSNLVLKFVDLDELPGKWQALIQEEMAKNAVINQEIRKRRKASEKSELLHGEKDIDTVSGKALDLSQIRIEWIEE